MRATRPVLSAPLLGLLLLSLPAAAGAGTVEGLLFEDLDADGLRDPGEPGVADVPLLLWWGNAMRFPGASGADGTFSVAADIDSHQIEVMLPAGWRWSDPDQTWAPPVAGPTDDVILARYGSAPNFRTNVERAADLYLYSLGDSIPDGFNLCGEDSDYIPDVVDDITFLTQETMTYTNAASAGAHSEDLLTPQLTGGGPNPQYVPNVIADLPDIVTINIGGNDFLSTDGDLQASLGALIDTRATLQEIISSLLIGLPTADVVVNTVYDNEADDCMTSDFHARLTPIWTQAVRWGANGQTRPVQLAEAGLDFAHQNVTRTDCAGAQGRICTFIFDRIHPLFAGAEIIRRATMEALGEVRVPDPGTIGGVQLGLLRRVAELEPTLTTVVGGSPTNEALALTTDDAGAVVPPGSELRLSGFSLPADVTPRVLIVRVRFRTTGDFADDAYRFEASFLDFQRPASLDVLNWDYLTPIVGGSGKAGSGQAIGNGVVNAVPDRPGWVEVSARATLNVVDDGTVTGLYSWPDPTAVDIAALQVRLRVEANGAADTAAVEWDSAVVEVYGQGGSVVPSVGEVSDVRAGEAPLTASRDAGGGVLLSWDAEPGVDVYRAYRGSLPAAAGDPAVFSQAATGTRCTPDTTLIDAEPVTSAYWLVAAVDAAGMEGPVGFDSAGAGRATLAPSCP